MRQYRPGADSAQWSPQRATGGAAKPRVALVAAVASATALIAGAAFVAIARAEPPTGVTPTLLARGIYDAFDVRSGHQGPIDFNAEAKAPIDVVVRRHEYAPHSTTGWHRHPGPVFITVTLGTLTYYEYNDPTCTPHTVSAGQGFVDDGRGHVVRNETDQPAQDVSVITAPVGGTFRTDLGAPNANCGF
jgi:quercetin dioxygenase-like cupin family protein